MKKMKSNWTWLFVLLVVVAINVLAAKFHARFDLTQEKRYSITTATKELLQQPDDAIQVDVFLKGELPAEFRRLATSAQEFVAEMKEANPAKINYRVLDPTDDAGGRTWADSLQAMGANPINLNVQLKSGEETRLVFPYALLRYKGESTLVNLFPSSKRNVTVAELNNAESMMEYHFVRGIDGLLHPQRPAVAYVVGNGEPMGPETYDLQQTVGAQYRLGLFNLQSQPAVPMDIDVLLIVKPSEKFTDNEKLKLDQYVMKGGKIVWFIDDLYAEHDSLSIKSQLIAYERGLNLEDILFNYGVRINPDLLMDLQCDFLPFAVGGSRENPQYEFLHWNYFPLFESPGNHLINKNLGLVAGRYVNSIDTVEAPGIRKTVLLQSSANSRTISTPALISPNENRNAPEDVLFRRKNIPAGLLLEGRFTSLYKNRVSRAQQDSLQSSGGYKEESEPNRMIVVADGDIVLNDQSPQQGPLPMGLNFFTVGTNYEYQFANRDFLLNCLEYLTSKSTIIQTRNKEIVLRMLDVRKVDEEKGKWQLINIALPILLIILFGFAYQQARRYRYAGR